MTGMPLKRASPLTVRFTVKHPFPAFPGLAVARHHLQIFPGFLAGLGHGERQLDRGEAFFNQAAPQGRIVRRQNLATIRQPDGRADFRLVDIWVRIWQETKQDLSDTQYLRKPGIERTPSSHAIKAIIAAEPAVPSAEGPGAIAGAESCPHPLRHMAGCCGLFRDHQDAAAGIAR
jgi:hypothetical protein